MALNPPISHNGIPYRIENEYMLLKRKGVKIEIEIPGKSKLKDKGMLYLTSGRLTFVNNQFSDK